MGDISPGPLIAATSVPPFPPLFLLLPPSLLVPPPRPRTKITASGSRTHTPFVHAPTLQRRKAASVRRVVGSLRLRLLRPPVLRRRVPVWGRRAVFMGTCRRRRRRRRGVVWGALRVGMLVVFEGGSWFGGRGGGCRLVGNGMGWGYG